MAPKKDRRPVTKKLVEERLRYDPETGNFYSLRNFAKIKIGDIAGSVDDRGYIQIMINQRFYYAHRLAWLVMTGEWPTDQIDHKNTNKGDNSWDNLREATNSQNLANRKNTNPHGFKGVSRDGNRFAAKIRKGGKATHIGSFATAEEAGDAYRKEAEREFGEYARYD